ncbi:uncharacterized protein [Notamacropus eugenii]|uniref:uncharacterized protein n=1 Tax=Notamacropus eugenii TaxID=9315 RepID=UPI003B67097D
MQLDIDSFLDSLKRIKENLNADINCWKDLRRRRMQMESGMGELRKKLDSMASRIELVQQRLLESEKKVKKRVPTFTDAAHQNKNGPGEDQKHLRLPKDNKERSEYRKNPAEQRLSDREKTIQKHDQNWIDEAFQETKNAAEEDQEDLRLLKKNKVRFEYEKKLEQIIADSEKIMQKDDKNWTDEAHQEIKSGSSKDQKDLRFLKDDKGRSECRKKLVEETVSDTEKTVQKCDQSFTDKAHQETKNGPGEDQKDLRLPKENNGRPEYREKAVEEIRIDSESRVKEQDQNWTDVAHQETKNGPGEDQKDLRLPKENNGRPEYREKAVQEIRIDSESRVKEQDQNWTDVAHQETKNGPGEDQKGLRLPKEKNGRSEYRAKAVEEIRADSESTVKVQDQNWTDEAYQETKKGPGEDEKGLRLPKEKNGRSEYRAKAVEEIRADSESRGKEQGQKWTGETHQETKTGRGEEQKNLRFPKQNKGIFVYRQKLAEQRRLDNKSKVRDYDQSLYDSKGKKPSKKTVENFVLQGKQIF